ncbi:hypothetical protein THAOC_02283 [Thalassiosira oceanica]|uniref:Uncharacterized protein n=1 Tax=Thalassiosira oceanica TaxID=159749 RepID=K0TM83_THAOC|nr:hypothetical protein THAOC_02283 [Thalassiosira oceanica]|eukprot:EJK75976.1 hypothetical protein THAOC_02283 [Thalassiosira oceanica]
MMRPDALSTYRAAHCCWLSALGWMGGGRAAVLFAALFLRRGRVTSRGLLRAIQTRAADNKQHAGGAWGAGPEGLGGRK